MKSCKRVELDRTTALTDGPIRDVAKWAGSQRKSDSASARYLSRVHALPQPYKMDMPQVAVASPIDKLELRHEHGGEPPTVRHLLYCETLAPTPTGSFGRLANGQSLIPRSRKRGIADPVMAA